MELFWLIMTIMSLLFVFYFVYKLGFEQVYEMTLLPVVAGFMYFMRRKLRKKSPENNNS